MTKAEFIKAVEDAPDDAEIRIEDDWSNISVETTTVGALDEPYILLTRVW